MPSLFFGALKHSLKVECDQSRKELLGIYLIKFVVGLNTITKSKQIQTQILCIPTNYIPWKTIEEHRNFTW